MFIDNLKPDVKKHVLLSQPKDLAAAIVKAERADNVEYSVIRNANTNNGPVPMELGWTNRTKHFGSSKFAVGVNNTQQRIPECQYCGKKGHVESKCYTKQSDQRDTSHTYVRSKQLHNATLDIVGNNTKSSKN